MSEKYRERSREREREIETQKMCERWGNIVREERENRQTTDKEKDMKIAKEYTPGRIKIKIDG